MARSSWFVAAAAVATFLPSCGAAPAADDGEAPAAATTQWRPEDHLDDIAGAAAVLEGEAQRRWPEQFAGAWIDRGAVWLAFTERPGPKVAQLRREVDQPHPIRGVRSRLSLDQLVALQERMSDDRSALQDGRAPAGMPEPIVETGGAYDLDIDVRRSVVVVGVEGAGPELRRAFRDYYATKAITFSEGVAAPGR